MTATQAAAVSANAWCLVLAGVFAALGCAVLLGRKATKSDYEAEDRLLHRELFADELPGFAAEAFGLAGAAPGAAGGYRPLPEGEESTSKVHASGNAWV